MTKKSWLAASPASASSITAISNTLMPIVTERLLNRSAKYPPVMENRMNGSANKAPTMPTSWSRFSFEKPITVISEITSHFRTLSLKAPWNWVMNRLQKPPSRFSGAGLVSGLVALAFMPCTVAAWESMVNLIKPSSLLILAMPGLASWLGHLARGVAGGGFTVRFRAVTPMSHVCFILLNSTSTDAFSKVISGCGKGAYLCQINVCVVFFKILLLPNRLGVCLQHPPTNGVGEVPESEDLLISKQ